MRVKRTIVNTLYALASSFVLMLLGLVTYKLFVANFGMDIPGYSATIEKLFSFFSVAEFGVGGVISYRLYEAIGQKDPEQISKYMSLYKWAYRVIGLVILGLALIFSFFLRLIVVTPDTNWNTVYTIYILQTISTLSSYFLVTRRLMYTCTQQGYRCTRIDLCFNIATSLFRIAIALWLPNIVLWFGITIVLNTMTNLVVAWIYRRDFPELHEVRVTVQDFKDLGLFHDMRYYLVHRVSNTVYGSSDNIVLTRMRGASTVTLLKSYTTISDSVTNVGNKIMDSFAAAIGNIVYDKNAEADGHARQVFWSMDLFSYAFGSFVAIAYFCLFQPFIRSWMGESFLLPTAFVFFFCLNEYIGWNHRMIGSYRAVLGRFEEDQWYMVASAVFNLVLSFVLVIPFGVAGVVGATVFAHLLMWIGRARVVCRHYMKGCGWRYLWVQLLHTATLLGEMALTAWLCGLLGSSFWALPGDFVIVSIVPNVLNLAIYGWTSDAAYLRGRAAAGLTALRQKHARRGEE